MVKKQIQKKGFIFEVLERVDRMYGQLVTVT